MCQALPGPASTKLTFCIALIHAGFVPALLAFALWSLPGAIGMYGLALGVQKISDVLPAPVYALLSGLNASTVGIIALAAVQLAEKAIRDRLTRILVIFGACAGLCYSALWYFPLLIAIGGAVTMVWDGWLGQKIGALKRRMQRRRQGGVREQGLEEVESVSIEAVESQHGNGVQRRPAASGPAREGNQQVSAPSVLNAPTDTVASLPNYSIRIKVGIAIVVLFFGMSILHGQSAHHLRAYSVFYSHPGHSRCFKSSTPRSQVLRKHVSRRHHHFWRRPGCDSTPARLCGRSRVGL